MNSCMSKLQSIFKPKRLSLLLGILWIKKGFSSQYIGYRWFFRTLLNLRFWHLVFDLFLIIWMEYVDFFTKWIDVFCFCILRITSNLELLFIWWKKGRDSLLSIKLISLHNLHWCKACHNTFNLFMKFTKIKVSCPT
jgi:hypothetical protein